MGCGGVWSGRDCAGRLVVEESLEEVRGVGAMLGLQLKIDGTPFVQRCMENGVLCLTAKDKVRLLPALNIPADVLKKALDIVKEACAGE